MIHLLHFNANRYGLLLNSHDLFKFAAIVFMTVDHIGFFFDDGNLWWRVAGRICVPIWFFFIGYARPSSPRKELYWLCAAMIAADVALVSPVFPINIFATVIAARWVVNYMEKRDKDWLMLTIFTFGCVALLPVTLWIFEYGSQLFLFSLAGYYMRVMPERALGKITMWIAILLFFATQYIMFYMQPIHGIVFAVEMVAVTLLLLRFRYRTYESFSHLPVISTIIRYTARNTQYYYTGHYLLFMLISRWMHPVTDWHLEWLATS